MKSHFGFVQTILNIILEVLTIHSMIYQKQYAVSIGL